MAHARPHQKARQRSAADLARPLFRRPRWGDRRAIGRPALVRSMAMVLRILPGSKVGTETGSLPLYSHPK
jgi:hypothetical protein